MSDLRMAEYEEGRSSESRPAQQMLSHKALAKKGHVLWRRLIERAQWRPYQRLARGVEEARDFGRRKSFFYFFFFWVPIAERAGRASPQLHYNTSYIPDL